MALSSFCGILTLQVGVVILSTVFFVVAFLVLGVNAFGYHQGEHLSWPINLILVVVFVILMLLSGITIFLAAYNESRTMCMAAVILIIITLAFWIILTIFSLANSSRDKRRVCIEQRCPESFWLASLNYTSSEEKEEEWDEETTTIHTSTSSTGGGTTSTPPTTAKRIRRLAREFTVSPHHSKNFIATNISSSSTFDTVNKVKMFNYFREKNLSNVQFFGQFLKSNKSDSDHTHKSDDTGGYRFGLDMVGALVFLIANFLFLIFAILVMWSYAQELRWDECCYINCAPINSAPIHCAPINRAPIQC